MVLYPKAFLAIGAGRELWSSVGSAVQLLRHAIKNSRCGLPFFHDPCNDRHCCCRFVGAAPSALTFAVFSNESARGLAEAVGRHNGSVGCVFTMQAGGGAGILPTIFLRCLSAVASSSLGTSLLHRLAEHGRWRQVFGMSAYGAGVESRTVVLGTSGVVGDPPYTTIIYTGGRVVVLFC